MALVPEAQNEGAIEGLVAQLEGGGWTQDRGYELLLAITTAARSGAGGALKGIALRDRVNYSRVSVHLVPRVW